MPLSNEEKRTALKEGFTPFFPGYDSDTVDPQSLEELGMLHCLLDDAPIIDSETTSEALSAYDTQALPPQVMQNWPYDKTTSEKLPWGTTGKNVVSYRWIQNHCPCDKTTSEKLPWGTTGKNVVSYQWIQSHWPYDKTTSKSLPWGTTGENVVSYKWIKSHWPCDKTTSKSLPWGTTGNHVVSYHWIQGHWPYDKTTNKRLPWGTTGENVVPYQRMQHHWPHDKTTSEKLLWGTTGKNVVSYQWIQSHWPYDKNTGEKLPWGTKGDNVISYRERNALKKLTCYARDIYDKHENLIHKKGDTPLNKRIAKWGPGTDYIVEETLPRKKTKGIHITITDKPQTFFENASNTPVTTNETSASMLYEPGLS